MTVGVTYERNGRALELERMAADAGIEITVARERWKYTEHGRERGGRGLVVVLVDGKPGEELGADYDAARGTLRTRIEREKVRAARARRPW